MIQIGNISEIKEVKAIFHQLMCDKLILQWEIPLENILTRLIGAHFFFEPRDDQSIEQILGYFADYDNVDYEENKSKNMSEMKYILVFK